MRIIGILLKCVLGACLLISTLYANDYKWNIILVSGDTISNCKLDSISSSDLFASTRLKGFYISVDSIAMIAHFGEGHFLSGALIVGSVGIISGALLTPGPEKTQKLLTHIPGSGPVYYEDVGPDYRFRNAVLYGIIGFLFGGVSGAIVDQDKIYDLRSAKNVALKYQIILSCLNQQ